MTSILCGRYLFIQHTMVFVKHMDMYNTQLNNVWYVILNYLDYNIKLYNTDSVHCVQDTMAEILLYLKLNRDDIYCL